jgi:hypothetical protein
MSQAAHPTTEGGRPAAIYPAEAIPMVTADLIARAEREANIVAGPDNVGPVSVIDLVAGPCMGLAPGDGTRLARANGIPSGRAVLVAVVRHVQDFVRKADIHVDAMLEAFWKAGANVLATAVSHTTVHELAHTLVSPPDADGMTDAEAERLVAMATEPLPPGDITPIAVGHDALWSIAAAILFRRLHGLHVHPSETLHALASHEFESYGLDYEPVLAIASKVGPDEPIVPLVNDPIFMAHVDRVTPPLEARREIVLARYGSPVGVPQAPQLAAAQVPADPQGEPHR